MLFRSWLRDLLKTKLAPELLDTAYRTELEANGPVAAAALMRDQLRRQPTLLALTRYFEAQAAENQARQPVAANGENTTDATDTPVETAPANAETGDQPKETEAIRDLLQLRTRNLARYTCRECGFRARLFYWQCPGCNR